MAAHSSGNKEYDLAWKSSLLSSIGSIIPETDITMVFLYGYDGSSSFVCQQIEPNSQYFLLPVCLDNGFFTRRAIPALLENLPSDTVLLPATSTSKEAIRGILQKKAYESIPEPTRLKTNLLIISHGLNSHKKGSFDPETSKLQQYIPGFKSYASLHLTSDFSEIVKSRNLLVIPKFLTCGKHSTQDIPRLIGLGDYNGDRLFGPHITENSSIYYASPLGDHPLFAELVASIIKEIR